ncbi:MAG: hypothetical protein ABIQ70_03270 [Dokdonella sp.]
METMFFKAHPIRRPAGVTALGLFFIFGTLMSGLSALSLLTHAAALEPMWQVKPAAREAFSQMGLWAPVLLGAVCLACASAALGFFTGTKWGYYLGVSILLLNLAGDIVNSLIGVEPRAWVGVPIVAVLLWYLSSRKVKTFFKGAT